MMTYLCCLFHKNEKRIALAAQFRLFKKKKKKKKRVWKVYMCIFSEKTTAVYGNLVKYQIVQCFSKAHTQMCSSTCLFCKYFKHL